MEITKKESTALKGLCIISIVMHNVLHLLTEANENEFTFKSDNVTFFYDNFLDSPFSYIFSFYGWLGVSFFIFISGYGLSVKYGHDNLFSWKWIKQHYLKLILLLFPAFLTYLLLILYKNPSYIDYWHIRYFVMEQLLLLNIVHPNLIQPGVYWYLGLAFQFYLWFLWLRKLSNKSLILIALCSCLLVAFVPEKYVSYVRHNSIGWMPEFISGMLLARYSHVVIGRYYRYVVLFLCVLFAILFSLSRHTFFLSGLCFIGILLMIREYIAKSKILLYLGGISASIYVVHPVIRQIWLDYILPSYNDFHPLILTGIILLISIGVSALYHRYIRIQKY